jgi:hypothetical protein
MQEPKLKSAAIAAPSFAPPRDVAVAGAFAKAMPQRRAAAAVPNNKGKGNAVSKRPAAAAGARKSSG